MKTVISWSPSLVKIDWVDAMKPGRPRYLEQRIKIK